MITTADEWKKLAGPAEMGAPVVVGKQAAKGTNAKPHSGEPACQIDSAIG
jgi:hypothetical protein